MLNVLIRIGSSILIRTYNIPLFYRNLKSHPSIIPICLLTWRKCLTLSGLNYPCLEQISLVPNDVRAVEIRMYHFTITTYKQTKTAAEIQSAGKKKKKLLWKIRPEYDVVQDSLGRDAHLLNTITKTRLFKYTENFTTKNYKFSDKNSDIFHISAQNIDCGYSLKPHRGDSNEYPQSMYLSRNNKNNVYPCKPQFYYIKVGFQGVKTIQVCFRDGSSFLCSISMISMSY